VHRERIAAELGIDLPTAIHTGLSDERKLHLAVGLNMRRRHLDADRRRDLVRKLHSEEGLSLRKIASITGWSKSTIDRDLKSSPFERVAEQSAALAADMAGADRTVATKVLGSIGEVAAAIFSRADYLWKSGQVPDDDERMIMVLGVIDMDRALRQLTDLAEGREATKSGVTEPYSTWGEWWADRPEEKRQDLISRIKSGESEALLSLWDRFGVPDGTPAR
jgi:hypothetical protein